MRAPISDEVLVGKFEQVKWIVDKWIAEVNEKRIPGVHVPDPGAHIVDWLRQFCGEVMLASRTLENVAEIMADMVE